MTKLQTMLAGGDYPDDVPSQQLFYNKSRFDAAGVEVPSSASVVKKKLSHSPAHH